MTPRIDKFWTTERKDLLRASLLEGLSMAQIWKKTNAVSRNAVIGKAHRMGLSKSPYWTDERRDELRRLFGEGYSATQVARLLGGISREGVIGEADRLKLKWRRHENPNFKLPKARRGPASAEREATLQSIFRQAGEATDLSPEKRESRNVGFFELADHQCKWPSGDPSMVYQLRFCGANRLEPYPYCAGHCRLAYRSAKEVERLEAWWAKRAQRWVAA